MAQDEVCAGKARRKATMTAVAAASWIRSCKGRSLGCGRGVILRRAGDAVRASFLAGRNAPEIGLGSFDPAGRRGITLAQAWAKAEELRVAHRAGRDVQAEREAEAAKQVEQSKQAERTSPTFETATLDYVRAHERSWRSHKYSLQWLATLRDICFPDDRQQGGCRRNHGRCVVGLAVALVREARDGRPGTRSG